jgi:streptogrisin C
MGEVMSQNGGTGRSIAAVLVAVIAGVGGATPTASAQTAPVRPETASVDAVTRAVMQERGISLEEARRRAQWQRRSAQLERLAAAELGDAFGGVWIGADDDRVKVGIVTGVVGAVKAATRSINLSELRDGADLVPVRHL